MSNLLFCFGYLTEVPPELQCYSAIPLPLWKQTPPGRTHNQGSVHRHPSAEMSPWVWVHAPKQETQTQNGKVHFSAVHHWRVTLDDPKPPGPVYISYIKGGEHASNVNKL